MYQYSYYYNDYYNWLYYSPQYQSYYPEKLQTYNYRYTNNLYKSNNYDLKIRRDQISKIKRSNCDSKSKQILKPIKLLNPPEFSTNSKNNSSSEEYKPVYSPESNQKLVKGTALSTDEKDLNQSSWTVNFTTPNRSLIEEKLLKPSAKEEEIRNAQVPIAPPATESIKKIDELGISGILMNSEEIKKWQLEGGDLKKHKIRDGPTQIISKNKPQPIEYEQNIVVKYLKPPTPPPVNIILEEKPSRVMPAPPLIVRIPQRPPGQPLTKIIREPLPKPPTPKPDIVIPIPNKNFYKPRKVVKEIIEQLPTPPPNITIEKWLPYKPAPHKVILKEAPASPNEEKTLNILWPTQQVNFKNNEIKIEKLKINS